MNQSTHYNFNKPELTDAPDITKVSDAIEAIDGVLYDKVDKEAGKGLSTNDYTTAEKNKVATIPSITTPAISISTSTGVLDSYTIRKFGNVIFLSMTVHNNNQVGTSTSDRDAYVGTINTPGLRPVATATGASYWGTHALGITIGTGGTITVRNASPSAFTPNSSNKISISVTYMVE